MSATPSSTPRIRRIGPSMDLQPSIDRGQDRETEEQVRDGEPRGRVERNDPPDERLHGEMHGGLDSRNQRIVAVVDQLEHYGMGTIPEAQMQRCVVRLLRVEYAVEPDVDMTF